jgi:hypothetical protein
MTEPALIMLSLGLHVSRGSTSLCARCPHGVAVLMDFTSPGARPPYALAVSTLQSSWAPRPYGLPQHFAFGSTGLVIQPMNTALPSLEGHLLLSIDSSISRSCLKKYLRQLIVGTIFYASLVIFVCSSRRVAV